MKSPEEIKKGLECGFCHECPYDNNELETVEECSRQVLKDALAYIQRLETERHQLLTKCERLERERDVLMWDARGCHSCKHMKNKIDEPPCDECIDEVSGWEWRGVCEENSKEEQQ